jgi:hypothetical protein
MTSNNEQKVHNEQSVAPISLLNSIGNAVIERERNASSPLPTQNSTLLEAIRGHNRSVKEIVEERKIESTPIPSPAAGQQSNRLSSLSDIKNVHELFDEIKSQPKLKHVAEEKKIRKDDNRPPNIFDEIKSQPKLKHIAEEKKIRKDDNRPLNIFDEIKSQPKLKHVAEEKKIRKDDNRPPNIFDEIKSQPKLKHVAEEKIGNTVNKDAGIVGQLQDALAQRRSAIDGEDLGRKSRSSSISSSNSWSSK